MRDRIKYDWVSGFYKSDDKIVLLIPGEYDP